MINEEEIQELKNKYPGFFKQFSSGFLDFIFSEKTSSKIAEICLANGIEEEEKIEKIAYRVVLALLNQVPKENLTEILVKGVQLEHETAENVSMEIEQSIFPQIPVIRLKEEEQIQKKPFATIGEIIFGPEKKKPKEPPKKDIYREPIK